jgi:pSer/pThr/pTyr-binding forkhead associated (FHA) protein
MIPMKKSSLIIRLEFNGSVVRETTSGELNGEITIGRSEQCTWRIPKDDRSASGVHAKIFLKGKKCFIQDLKSRNGIYYMGSKIQERRLTPGDVYSIGDCKLYIEKPVETGKKKQTEQYHKLEQLTGQDRGKLYLLTKSCTKMGAASDCDIVLNDSLVSKLHATLENHSDDTCWIKDMGSRNGTKINGTPLTEENAETGRMLKDGDIISIAYLEFRFWDKTVVHIRSHLFLKIGIVAATLAIVLGGYFAFQTISPSAKSIRLSAEKLAARGEFEKAKEVLVTATTARGADSDASQRLDLSRKLDVWKETYETWNKIQTILSGQPGLGDFYDANDLFSKITSADRERWQWNVSNASVEMKKAQETQELLSNLLAADDLMTQSEESITALKNAQSKLKESLEACRKNPQPYQTAMQADALDLVNEMEKQIEEHNEIQTIMGNCVAAAKLDQTIAELTKLRDKSVERTGQRKKNGQASSASTDIMCKKLLAVLGELRDSRLILDENYLQLAQFEFAKFKEDLHLPSNEACILSPNLSVCRLEMEQDNQRLKLMSMQMKNFQTIFKDNNIAPGMDSDLLETVFDDDVWEKVLACDCIEKPQPSYSEKTARSKYDQILGVYAFWEYLRSIGGDFDTTIFEERFKPTLFVAKDLFSNIEIFVSFCEPMKQSSYYHAMQRMLAENDSKNTLTKYLKRAKDILNQRNELIEKMYNEYQESDDTRDGIIAGGVAHCLVPDNWTLFKADELAKDVSASLKALRAKVSKLNEQSLDTTPEQRIENEKKIIRTGIPGDALLKQPWADQVPAEK